MRRILQAAGALLMLCVAAPMSSAQSRAVVIPSVAFGAVYDDNISAQTNAEAGQMLQIRPSLEASLESPKVKVISLWSFDMQRSNHSSLNSLDARQHAMADLAYRPRSATTFGLMGRYDRTDTPGELNLETGLLTDRQFAQRWEVRPSLTTRQGTRNIYTAAYNMISENLVGEDAGNLHSARLNFSRLTSTRSTVTAGYLGRLFVDDTDEHQSHAVLLGWTNEFASKTTFSIQAGPRHTTYRGLEPEVVVGFARIGHKVTTGADYWHGETIILGVQGPVAIDNGSLRAIWTATRKVELGLRAGMSKIGTLDDRYATIYRGSVVGSWSIRGPFTLAASYDADYQIGDIRRNYFADERVVRHVVRVGVTVAPSFSRSFLPQDEAARAKGVTR
jgi:hypothetical protein